MSTPRKRIRLPEFVEGNEVGALLSELRQFVGCGNSVSLLASDVKKVSTLGLQVLVAAKAMSDKRNLHLSIEDPSPAFSRACADTGLTDILGVTGVVK